jgi:hypothetical protein
MINGQGITFLDDPDDDARQTTLDELPPLRVGQGGDDRLDVRQVLDDDGAIYDAATMFAAILALHHEGVLNMVHKIDEAQPYYLLSHSLRAPKRAERMEIHDEGARGAGAAEGAADEPGQVRRPRGTGRRGRGGF